jgi:hypothetical protein
MRPENGTDKEQSVKGHACKGPEDVPKRNKDTNQDIYGCFCFSIISSEGFEMDGGLGI